LSVWGRMEDSLELQARLGAASSKESRLQIGAPKEKTSADIVYGVCPGTANLNPNFSTKTGCGGKDARLKKVGAKEPTSRPGASPAGGAMNAVTPGFGKSQSEANENQL